MFGWRVRLPDGRCNSNGNKIMNQADKRISWTHEGVDYFAEILCTDTVEITSQGKELHQQGSVKLKDNKTPRKKKEDCGGCGKNGVNTHMRNTMGLTRLVRGAGGLLKAELGIGGADDDTIIDRKNICESCEHYDFGVCNECGCFCSAKVKLKSEKCPVGRW